MASEMGSVCWEAWSVIPSVLPARVEPLLPGRQDPSWTRIVHPASGQSMQPTTQAREAVEAHPVATSRVVCVADEKPTPTDRVPHIMAAIAAPAHHDRAEAALS